MAKVKVFVVDVESQEYRDRISRGQQPVQIVDGKATFVDSEKE